MPKAGFVAARVSFLMLAAGMLGAGMLTAPAAGAASSCTSSAGKCFAVSVSPSAPAAGSTVSFAFVITNEAKTQQLGSARITVPAANFVITGASVPSGAGTTSFTSSSATFVNLALAPSAATKVIVTAILPCSGSSYTWGMEVKQSNDFSGPPGNDFQLDPASAGNLSGSLSGSCSLAFTSDGQPSNTAASPAVITSGFGSSGGPVKVAVFDGSGQPITNQAAIGSVTVTVALGAKPGSGTLSGTITGNTSAGVVSFSDLTLSQQGVGYTLTATTKSPGFDPGSSHDFTIFGQLQKCKSSTSCTSSLSSSTTSGTVTTTTSPPPGDSLGTGIGGVSASELYGCGTYQPVSDPFSFNVYTPSGNTEPGAQFSALLDINKSLVKSTPGRSSALSWQVCYASTTQFTPRPGFSLATVTIGGVNYFAGLLPDCSATQPAPCVQNRTKSGDVVITFLAVGDPFYRG